MTLSNSRQLELNTIYKKVLIGVIITSGIISNLSFAQTVSDTANADRQSRFEIEEVIVTATRRETSAQRTPIAISAFEGEELRHFSVNNGRDLMGMIPNLYAQRVTTSPSTQTFGMRGLGQTDTVADPTVGTYIDDIYLPRNVAQLFDMPGLERIEVLRGPQGTLYGRNSTGGAVKFVTIQPGNETRMHFSAGVGNLDAYEARGFLSGPVFEDKVFGSLAAVHVQRGGYTHNLNTGKDVNDLNQSAIRGKLRFLFSERLEFEFIADYEGDRSNTVNYVPSPATTPAGQVFDNRETYENGGASAEVDAYGFAGKFIFEINDKLVLKSITAYRKADGFYPNEFDGLPVQAATHLTIDHETYSQDFQLLGDFAWGQVTAGLFYFHENYVADARNALSAIPFFFGGLGELETDSYAAYGQVDIPLLNEKLTLTVGGRYTYEKRHFDAAGYLLDSDLNVTGFTYMASPSTSANAFTPKVSLQYQWTDDVMTYASYAKGFQAGGYSMRATSATVANLDFGNEEVETYELGLRADWFDHRLRTNITAFYNDVTGKQVTVFLPQFSVGAVQNAAEAFTKGIEFEMQTKVTEYLELAGNIGYLKARFTDWPNAFGCPANCTNGDGVHLVYSPKWTANARMTYERPVPFAPGLIGFSAELQYQARAYTRVPNGTVLDETRTSEPGTYLNGSIWYQPTDQWTLKVALRNIADEDYQVYNFGIPGLTDGISYTVPRTVLFSVAYDY